ncbi:MAG: trypsin-like peptidase domain-containing protein [Planctomycetes bacterium]|nr:trypsin-like peptidase domain-containing protein [Planctomycetota bacterium]
MARVRNGGPGASGFLWLVVVGLALVAPTAPAVVIQTTTGTGNTTAPADDPGWSAVGARGIGTGVYVGGGWVLTAAHVWSGPITLSGSTYFAVPGSEVRLTNAGLPGMSADTDLMMYRLTVVPSGIAAPRIAAATPAVGAAVTMIGAGRDRQPGLTEWSVNTAASPWTWTEVASGGDAAGYKANMAARSMRWGTNTLSGTGAWISYGYGDVKTVVTTFDLLPGSSEAQASYGDSGGGVFTKNGADWELAGLMLTVDGYSGQPDAGANAVFGNVTFSADLALYRPQIMAIVPEPSALLLAGIGAGWLLLRSRRRR